LVRDFSAQTKKTKKTFESPRNYRLARGEAD